MHVPKGVKLKSVDLTVSLESLSFFLAQGVDVRTTRSASSGAHATRARRLTHVDARGAARMVDVGDKPVTAREAVARGRIRMSAARASRLIRAGPVKKGDPLQAARLAGIMAAKQTATLIPLCHPLPLSGIEVDAPPAPRGYEIRARVRTTAQTGVEMEALTAVAVAALTIYDMVKAVDKIDDDLRHRAGVESAAGVSGDYRRAPLDRAR